MKKATYVIECFRDMFVRYYVMDSVTLDGSQRDMSANKAETSWFTAKVDIIVDEDRWFPVAMRMDH